MGRPALLAAAAAPALAGAVLWGPALLDDVHITLSAARAFARSGVVRSTTGAALEQSSSLLHTVLLGVLEVVTPWALPTLAVVVGVIAAAAAVLVTHAVAERLAAGAGLPAAVVVAVSTPVVYWAWGGLETVLVALALPAMLAAWAQWWCDPGRWPAAVALTGVYLGLRPEAPFVALSVVAGTAAVLAVTGTGPARAAVGPAGRLAGAVAAWTAAYTALRLWMFGAVLPRPVATKVSGIDLRDGLSYLGDRLTQLPAAGVLLVVAVVAAIVLVRPVRADPADVDRGHAPRRVLAALLGSAVLAVVAFSVTAGGDWMPGPRLLVPAIGPAAALVAGWAAHRGRVLPVAVLVAAEMASLVVFAGSSSVGTPVWDRPDLRAVAVEVADRDVSWAEQGARVAVRDLPALAAATDAVSDLLERQRRVTVASHQAGMLIRHLTGAFEGRVEFVDLGNLSTAHLDSCRDLLISSPFGAVITWERFLADPGRCGLAPPDVVFDVGDPARLGPDFAEGYTVVLRSRGALRTDGPLAGAPLRGATFVAVRTRSAAARPDGPVVVDWPAVLARAGR